MYGVEAWNLYWSFGGKLRNIKYKIYKKALKQKVDVGCSTSTPSQTENRRIELFFKLFFFKVYYKKSLVFKLL